MDILNKISGIYVIYNKITRQCYIGKSSCVKTRISTHKKLLINNKHVNTHLQNSFNIYKLYNFEFDLIEETPLEQLLHMENYWCNMLYTHNRKYGYNIQPINVLSTGLLFSDETRLKMSNSQKGKKKTETERIKMSKIRKGKPIHTEESKELIRKSNRKRSYTKETLLKMSLSAKNRVNRIFNPFANMSQEKRKAKCEKTKKKICQYDLNGVLINTFNGIVDATKYGFTMSGINGCCRKRTRKHREFVFRYENDPFSLDSDKRFK